jgi:CheY-like chemotaxis protein
VGRVTGAAIAKEIRELESIIIPIITIIDFMANPRTPMIAISVNPIDIQKEFYAESNVDAFFAKPLTQNILQKISQFLYK